MKSSWPDWSRAGYDLICFAPHASNLSLQKNLRHSEYTSGRLAHIPSFEPRKGFHPPLLAPSFFAVPLIQIHVPIDQVVRIGNGIIYYDRLSFPQEISPLSFTRGERMVEKLKKKTVLLMADDDEDDCLLMEDAVGEVFRAENFHCLRDGQELMDYLLHRGDYTDTQKFPPPNLIFLDLNMPRKDGFETLKEIKEHPELRAIPILIFSTSQEQEQIELSYKLGANSYITKPMSFDDLVKTVRCLSDYWFGVALLPLTERLGAGFPPEAQPFLKNTQS